MKPKFGALASMIIAMAANIDNNYSDYKDDELSKIDNKPVVPNGCKKYYFNNEGIFISDDVDFYFTCIAINESSAKKKFNRRKKELETVSSKTKS